MAGLINESVNARLDLLVQKLFAGNRLMDRAMSQLDVKFVMNKTASILHGKLAHKFLALADQVSEWQSGRNMQTVYGLTPLDATDYDSELDVFLAFVGYMSELEDIIKEAHIVAIDNDDCFTSAFLQTFMMDVAPVTKQCLLLLDKAQRYNGNFMQFDHNVEDFIVL